MGLGEARRGLGGELRLKFCSTLVEIMMDSSCTGDFRIRNGSSFCEVQFREARKVLPSPWSSHPRLHSPASQSELSLRKFMGKAHFRAYPLLTSQGEPVGLAQA